MVGCGGGVEVCRGGVVGCGGGCSGVWWCVEGVKGGKGVVAFGCDCEESNVLIFNLCYTQRQ